MENEMNKEPTSVKVYIKELCTVKGLSSTVYKMFNFMLNNMDSTNHVFYAPTVKHNFLVENNIANSTFNNNISKMIKAGLIERTIWRGEFRINKKFAVKV